MVAYSFKAQFEEPIVSLEKRQTVRGHRKRHARPGEPVQLFVAMRTRDCRKLLTPDPICTDVRDIRIEVDLVLRWIVSIEIEGVPLSDAEIEDFAIADGFDDLNFSRGHARSLMGQFWAREHREYEFSGVVIRWDPQ
jgi:hypothetical protein